MAPEHFVKRLV